MKRCFIVARVDGRTPIGTNPRQKSKKKIELATPNLGNLHNDVATVPLGLHLVNLGDKVLQKGEKGGGGKAKGITTKGGGVTHGESAPLLPPSPRPFRRGVAIIPGPFPRMFR